MLKRLIMTAALSALLVGCSAPAEEEIVPTPEYLSVTEVTLAIGDERITYTPTNNEAVQAYTDKQITILPDKMRFSTVQVDYIQGNSLNDYIQAYYDGISGEKSELIDGTFTTGSKAYSLKQTEDLNYIIVCGDKSNESFVNELCERL